MGDAVLLWFILKRDKLTINHYLCFNAEISMERIVNLHTEKLSEGLYLDIGENEHLCLGSWRFRDNDRIFAKGVGSA